jgi:hypothetical protein
MSRKLAFSIAGLVILTLAFIVLALRGGITDGIFLAWIGGVLGLVGVYTGGNVMSKKYRPNDDSNPNQGIRG